MSLCLMSQHQFTACQRDYLLLSYPRQFGYCFSQKIWMGSHFYLDFFGKKNKTKCSIATVVVYFCTNLHTYCRNCLRHCLFSGSTFPTLFGLFSPLTLIELSYESSGTLAQEILILCLTILLKAQINAMRN